MEVNTKGFVETLSEDDRDNIEESTAIHHRFGPLERFLQLSAKIRHARSITPDRLYK